MSTIVHCNSSGRSFVVLTTVRTADTQTGAPLLPRKQNFFSGAISSCSQTIDQSFTICPVEIEIPGSACKHFLCGIKAKDPRTWFMAVQYATLRVCQNDPGNVRSNKMR
jgi:hypothetical protein